MPDEPDPVSHRVRIVDIDSDDDNRGTLGAHLTDELVDRLAGLGVHTAGGFTQDVTPWLLQRSTPQDNLLLVPAAEKADHLGWFVGLHIEGEHLRPHVASFNSAPDP